MKKEEIIKIHTHNLSLFYGDKQALKDISMTMNANKVTAFIGPSGCGKSTFIRSINRMNDLIEGVRITGEVKIEDVNIYAPEVSVANLRKRVGMVFQKSNPFPKSIYENVAYGPRINGITDKAQLDDIVERSLKGAALWNESKERLTASALSLSGGQQQRLCIARAIAVNPDILLMDEPCSALDPISTSKVEELILELKENYTIVIVTHSMQQAARVSDWTGFFWLGRLVEFGPTEAIFSSPQQELTEAYITGRRG